MKQNARRNMSLRRPEVKLLIQCKKIFLLLAISGALIIFTTLAVAIRGDIRGGKAHSSTTSVVVNKSGTAPATAAAVPNPKSRENEGEVITIRSTGFDPPEITRQKGRFTLLVDNRSGLDEISLRLDREAGGRLHQVRSPKEKPNWVQGVDLPPGRYILTEENHPNWACRITVTP